MRKISILTENVYSFFRWLEKYAKTDIVYLAKGGFWLTLGTILSSIVSIFLALAFANLLTPETYGTYQYLLSTIGILSIASLAGMNTAVTQSTARGFDGDLDSSLKEKIKWGFWGSLISAGIALYYFIKGNNVLALGFSIGAIFIPFWESFGIYVAYLLGKKDFKRLSLYELSVQAFSTVFVILAVWISKNAVIILLTFFTAWLFFRIIFFLKTKKTYPPSNQTDPTTLNYGKHLSVMTGINSLSGNIDKIILWHFLGPAQLASYIFALTIPIRIAGLSKIVNRIAFPKFAEKNIEELKDSLPSKVLKLSIILFSVFLVYIIFTPFIFNIFFPKYTNVVFYSQLAGILIFLQPLMLFSTSLTATVKKKELYIYNFFSPLVKILLFIILIPIFGILGAVIGLLFSKLIDGLILFYLFKKSSSTVQHKDNISV